MRWKTWFLRIFRQIDSWRFQLNHWMRFFVKSISNQIYNVRFHAINLPHCNFYVTLSYFVLNLRTTPVNEFYVTMVVKHATSLKNVQLHFSRVFSILLLTDALFWLWCANIIICASLSTVWKLPKFSLTHVFYIFSDSYSS